MKKILTIFLAASLLLVACGKDKEEEKKDTKQEEKCLNFLNQVLFGNH